jgi:hypothetical protein
MEDRRAGEPLPSLCEIASGLETIAGCFDDLHRRLRGSQELARLQEALPLLQGMAAGLEGLSEAFRLHQYAGRMERGEPHSAPRDRPRENP